jgi:peptidoglycan/xylan/chitin deacetylase (PgdA/CDA1 family)
MYKSVGTITALDLVAKYTGLLTWMRGRCRPGITILMYHKVLPAQLISQYPMPNLVVEESVFRRQIKWLQEHFEVLRLCDAIDYLSSPSSFSLASRAPLACITFDDGYLDNFVYAAPILDEAAVKATFFITTSFVDGNFLWFDRAAHLWCADQHLAINLAQKNVPDWRQRFSGKIRSHDEWVSILKQLDAITREKILAGFDASILKDKVVYSPMNWRHVAELRDRGHEIGAHSVTHPILTRVSDDCLEHELVGAMQALSSVAGEDIVGVCYPNGNYDQRVVALSKSAGFRYGCTVDRGMASWKSNRMTLPRRAILSSKRPDPILIGFEAEVVGYHDFLRGMRKRFRF